MMPFAPLTTMVASIGPRSTLREIIYGLGLQSGISLILDPGDAASYPGTGNKWLDLSGGGYDFFIGDGAGANQPTFTGTVNNRSNSTHWSLPNLTDHFTYDTTNEAWMNNMFAPGSSSLVTYFVAGNPPKRSLFSNAGVTGTTGVHVEAGLFYPNPAPFDVPRILWAFSTTTGTFDIDGYDSGKTITNNAAYIWLISRTDNSDGSFAWTAIQNGSVYGLSGGPSTSVPSNSTATYRSVIGIPGDLNTANSGDAFLYVMAIWGFRALTQAELTKLNTSLSLRFYGTF